MSLKYFIIGGCLTMHKNIFIQEMLGKESLLRTLLNWRTTWDFKQKHPLVSEPDSENMIRISFNADTRVETGGSPKELLGPLKARYREKIRGRVDCRIEYPLFGGLFPFSIDLDSDDGEIVYEE